MDLSTLTDAQVLGLTAAAEARSYLDPTKGWRLAPIENMVAVMCAVANRVKANPARFGATITAACLAPHQFSCWTEGSGSNHDWLVGQVELVKAGLTPDGIVQGCIGVAGAIVAGRHADTVNGATHYYAPASMVPPGRVPDWAKGKTPVAEIGDHLFFVGV
jgi:spore germination cell wall hydrolase CwlJ-like protein